eukprot:gene2499-3092_t
MRNKTEIIIPSENVGSIPRPQYLLDAMRDRTSGRISEEQLKEAYNKSRRETIQSLIETGSQVITDGEQLKPSFITYPVFGSNQMNDAGFKIQFVDGHYRQLPVLNGKNLPFKYKTYAKDYLLGAQCITNLPIKQPVISVSAMSLLYPNVAIDGYSRDQFFADMLNEVEKDIRDCLDAGAHSVQIDATEARLSLKLDPSGDLLKQFISLNNEVLSRFSPEELKRIGIHSCAGGDNSTHSLDVDYTRLLLPSLFQLKLGRFYLEFAAEDDKIPILECIKRNLKPNHIVFIGVINVLSPKIETPEEVRDLILQIAKYIPFNQLGTTDDCGFSPFQPNKTSREIAFAKIKARIEGTKLAESILNQVFQQ